MSLSGCAGWFHPREIAIAAPVKAVPLPPQEPPKAQNIGSIWSEGSKWNDLYSGKESREIGDLILLNPTDGFRIAVAERKHQSAVQVTSYDRENSHIVGRIKQVLSRGVYSVEGHQGLTVGGRYYEVRLSGKVREQDIAPDDTASTDSLFELSFLVDSDTSDPDAHLAKSEVSGKSKSNDKAPDKSDDKADEKSKEKAKDVATDKVVTPASPQVAVKDAEDNR